MGNNKFAALAVAAAVLGFASAASAAPPLGEKPAVKGEVSGSVQSVDWRPYRHCHWYHGRRWCHGGKGYWRPGWGWGWGWGHRHHHRW